MKKLLVLSALVLMAVGGVARADDTSKDAILNLTGSVTPKLAIDISEGDTCDTGNHVCSRELGEMTQGFAGLKVASLGVEANDGYRVLFYSENGGMLGQDSGNNTVTQDYKLAWEDIGSAVPVSAVAGQAAQGPFQPTATAIGSYECSLAASCPAAPSARHDVLLSMDQNLQLSAGKYADVIHFHIVNGEDPAAQ
jgi:hypothetical protein